jgi:hypothetical protein
VAAARAEIMQCSGLLGGVETYPCIVLNAVDDYRANLELTLFEGHDGDRVPRLLGGVEKVLVRKILINAGRPSESVCSV